MRCRCLLTLYVVALFLPPALIPQFQLILRLGLYNSRPGYIMLFLINPIGLIILVNYIKSVRANSISRLPSTVAVMCASSSPCCCR